VSGVPSAERSERDWLLAHQIQARRRFGQNFLLEPRIPELIVERAGLSPGGRVLEIGPGAGALTDALLRAGQRVDAIELDSALLPLLEERFRIEIAAGALSLRQGDVLDLTEEDIAPGAVLFGNLPYAITSPILIWATRRRARLESAVVMVQREVAERIAASPGGKEYGSLTVFLRAQAEVRTLLKVGRSSFWPRPGVESSVIELRFVKPSPWTGEIALLERVLRAAFGQRRKTLENGLAHGLGIAKEDAAAALSALALDPSVRAEMLSVEQFGRLTEELAARRLLPVERSAE